VNRAIYEGIVRHRRSRPARHAFRYPLFMVYLDLAELPTVFAGRWLWSTNGPAPAWFRRRDFHGDPAVPLTDAVRDTVAARTGARPAGPIRLLTHLRYFGYSFNPVSFYYCYDAAATRVDAIVAEITNTPWGERRAYVLPRETGDGKRETVMRFRFEKRFHVSPFMPMDQRYDWRFSEPGRKLGVHMENFDQSGKLFDATLSLTRHEISGPALAALLLRYPLMTLRVVTAIHWNALRLWLKGNSFHPHPARVT